MLSLVFVLMPVFALMWVTTRLFGVQPRARFYVIGLTLCTVGLITMGRAAPSSPSQEMLAMIFGPGMIVMGYGVVVIHCMDLRHKLSRWSKPETRENQSPPE